MIKSLALAVVVTCIAASVTAAPADQRDVKTPYYSIALTPDGTAIESLSLDSLGKGEFRPSALFAPEEKAPTPTASQLESPGGPSSSPKWQFKFSENSFQI